LKIIVPEIIPSAVEEGEEEEQNDWDLMFQILERDDAEAPSLEDTSESSGEQTMEEDDNF